MANCTTILNWTSVLSETMPMLDCGSTIGCLNWLPWQPFSRLGWIYLWEDGCFLFDYVRFMHIQFSFKFNISTIHGNTNIFLFLILLALLEELNLSFQLTYSNIYNDAINLVFRSNISKRNQSFLADCYCICIHQSTKVKVLLWIKIISPNYFDALKKLFVKWEKVARLDHLIIVCLDKYMRPFFIFKGPPIKSSWLWYWNIKNWIWPDYISYKILYMNVG